MLLSVIVVGLALAAIIIPIVRSLSARAPAAPRVRRPAPKRLRDASVPPPVRLVVNKSDMDRELSALLAKDRRDPRE
jgi:hypothetical protein